MSSLRLYAAAHPVTALGPGSRLVLWVAGCGRDCPGCISPEMQPRDAGRDVPVDTLLRRIRRIETPLDGVTISGGEPFDQAGPLRVLLEALAGERPEWSVLVYSGYVLEELREEPSRAALLGMTDILIDGPYLEDFPPQGPIAGSGNQRIHYLTARGAALRAQVESLPAGRVNLGLSRSGKCDMIIGVSDARDRAALCGELGVGGGDDRAPDGA